MPTGKFAKLKKMTSIANPEPIILDGSSKWTVSNPIPNIVAYKIWVYKYAHDFVLIALQWYMFLSMQQ